MATKVLFIGGSGRNGSTFLSMLLSQNTDTFNVGQIRDFPAARRRNAPCTCGQPLKECNFWSSVVDGLKGEKPLPRIARGYRAFRKDVVMPDNVAWANKEVRQRIAKEHSRFLRRLGNLYAQTAEQAGGKVLVDSSKSPELAFALSLVRSIDLYVLNLVRDPRAVACSWAKVTPDADKLRNRSREWRKRQQRLGRLKKKAPKHFMLLRYEDLTANPRAKIASVLEWAGVEVSTDNFLADDRAKIEWNDLHIFPPVNKDVLSARASEIEIKAADSWKNVRNTPIHKLAETGNFPAAERYGYAAEIASSEPPTPVEKSPM